MNNKATSQIVLKYAREKGWNNLRKVVYGQGEQFSDIFRDSAEATAISNFINSRMFAKDIIKKITLE